MHDDSPVNDIQLDASDIRQIENADEVAHFFARLNYDVDVRATIPLDTPVYTSSQDMKIQISHHELIATDPADEDIRIYLFEVRSVTAKLRNDLHWNPTRMVQRAGRIDRLGSTFDVLSIYNMFPERALEKLLGLVRSLTAKIDVINQAGFLDASVLGEVVTPRDFNTLKRIANEDNAVIEEQETFLELASSEALMAELQRVLGTDASEWLTDLDDGIHSGLERSHARGMFFYFTAPRENGRAHFWRYYDLKTRKIIDNRYQIMQLIACSPDTPRFPPPYQEVDVFEIQEHIIESILGDVEQQEAAAIINKPISEEQTLISQILQEYLNNPDFDRRELREYRKFLKQPLVGASIQRLREALQAFSNSNDVRILIDAVQDLYQQQSEFVSSDIKHHRSANRIQREDLQLLCYEYIYA